MSDTTYPTQRDLCGVYFRVKRDGKWGNVCFSDMTHEEREELTERSQKSMTLEEQRDYWYRMACIMADALHDVGDAIDIVMW